MTSKVSLLCVALLLLIIQIHSSGAHPLEDQDSENQLDSFKGVLERLDQKLSLIEAFQSEPDVAEPRMKDDVELVSPDDSEFRQPKHRLSQNSQNVKDSFLKDLRSLQNRKMLRASGCFGRRIDRIGSLSGMGCNGSRRF
uniref:B-type natriuretic peptide n=1 Tax=Leptobrachium leishanense TaxID=445787 RepID=A0A8C5QK63_9ANUR